MPEGGLMFGYAGKILHIDLTGGTVEIEEPSEEFYRTYLGGSALGLYYLFKNTPAGCDPLGPDNTLTFALSGTVGAPISGQSRCTVVAKSPLTDAVGDSQAGGFWPAELKFAGFDAIVIRGTSPRPAYLWIKDGTCELRDATHLWGRTTREVDALLADELDDARIQVAQCGPAGEKLVRFAAIMNMANRAHGRGGMGAVMGSKRLKAIVVRGGKKRLPMADPDGLRDLMSAARTAIPKDPDVAGLAQYGTADIVESQELAGGLPTRNWQSGSMGVERAEAISGSALFDRYLRGAEPGTQMKDGRDTCYSCAVRCKRVVEAEWAGRSLDPDSGGPEYETISAFGSYCDVSDLGAISYASQLCNEHGVDTISAGATMAFAIECFERGLLTAEDTDGIELRWGDASAMIAMLEKTLTREGFGDTLAEGSFRAAAAIGKGAEHYFIGAKKQEMPAHMPHVKRSLALIYAVNPFGADHQSSEHDPNYEPEVFDTQPEKYAKRMNAVGLDSPLAADVLDAEKVRFTLRTQYAFSAMDTANVCQFVFGPGWELLGMDELARMTNAVTGWDLSVDDLMLYGERRLNMLRAFNAREGLTRDDDTLPRRLFDEPLRGGASEGIVIAEAEFDAALDEYYRQAQWDPETGNPTRETLERLDLGWVADLVGV